MKNIEAAIVAFRQGHRDAFDIIHHAYKQRLWAYLCSRAHTHEDAQDLFGTVSFQVARDINQLRDSGQLISWVIGIAVNRVRDYYRKRKAGTLQVDPQNCFLVDPVPSAEAELLQQERLRQLCRCIAGLPEPQKAYFELQYLAEVPQKDIASMRQLNLNVLKSHVFRAKAKVMLCMRRHGFLPAASVAGLNAPAKGSPIGLLDS